MRLRLDEPPSEGSQRTMSAFIPIAAALAAERWCSADSRESLHG